MSLLSGQPDFKGNRGSVGRFNPICQGGFPVSHRARRRNVQPRLESLDDRILLSSVPTVTIQDRVLFVEGTDGDDVIDVTIRPFQAGGRLIPVVRVSGIPRWFPANRFDLVAVNAKAGDDIVTIHDRGLPLLPVWIDGGEGHDTITGSSSNDTIMGGPGDDVIDGGGGDDVIDGGPGWNIINGVPDPLPPTSVQIPEPGAARGSPEGEPEPRSIFPNSGPESIALAADEWVIVQQTNEARVASGLPPLVVSESLLRAARLQAENMARLNRIAHELPETDTPTLSDRARAAGYRFISLAENLGFNYRSPSQVMEGWLGSEGHRRNILTAEFTEIGVAIAHNSFGQAYHVQVFGQPTA